MRRTIRMDDGPDLESLSVDDQGPPADVREPLPRKPRGDEMPPSVIARTQRCDSPRRELFRNGLPLDAE